MDKRFEGKTPEQILEMLTLEQKCGQLVSTGIGCWEECETAMEHHVGNLSVIYGHDAEALARFKADMERLQREADIPFFIGVDMETGVGQTVHDRSIATEFAEQMAIGAIADLKDAERLAYEEGRVVSQQASYLGWNICFGPVVDVNINPENPITNIRSFGEDPDIVATLAAAYIKGLQSDGRLIGTAKHFPGAGMQFSDSHFALEKTRTTKEEMEKIHLKPFKKAIEAGVGGLMCNHAIYDMYDAENVATLSKAVMTDLLRGELGFEGVMYTDAMGMAGMTESEKNCGNPHMGTIRAITAGCDVILGPNDAWNAPAGLAQAVRDGILDEEIVNKACLRVLKQKYALGLFSSEKRADVPKRDGWAVAREIAKKSVTLIRDRKNAIPIDFEGKKVMVMEPTHPANRLSFGLYSNMTLIKETLAKYVPQAQLALFAPDATDEQIAELAKQAKAADIVVFGTSFRSRSGQVGLMTERQLDALKAVHAANPNMIAVVSNPYVASQLPFVDEIVCCYSTSSVAVEAAVDVIIGKEKALGVLRETIPEEMHNEVEIVFHG